MRKGVLRLNAEHQGLLSNDLGAVAGFLFDIGAERYPVPPRDAGAAADADLASGAAQAVRGLYLVAPDSREEDVRKQLARPAFRRIGELSVRYLPYGELERNRQSMARFGEGLKAIDAVARALV